VDRQTRATAIFSADMAPLGQPLAAAPFRVDCGGVGGSGRWTDTRTWNWQLERPLQAGERCVFTLKANLKDLSGEPVGGRSEYRFYPPGPWPRRIEPTAGAAIEEDQAFVLSPAGPVDPATIDQHVWCEAEGVGHRIPIRTVDTAQRAAVLDSLHRKDENELVLHCAERLPPGARMKLVWGKGVATTNGTRSKREESFAYTVRTPFRATLSCEREKASAPCSPLAPVVVEFSAPVAATVRSKVRLVTPEGVRTALDPDPPGTRNATLQSLSFAKPLPQNAELRLELPADLSDDAGRPLANAASFPLVLRTGGLPPLAKFPGDFGILEWREGGILPVTVRNLEASLKLVERRLTDDAEIVTTMQALARFNRQTRTVRLPRDGKTEEFVDPYYARELSFLAGQPGTTQRTLPKPGGGAEFEVVGIPLEKPGYHVVEVESRLLGTALLAQPKPMYVRTAALVTNLAVHFKRGRDNALVWVTALDSGAPVGEAAVRISDCTGKPLWNGKTDAQGRALIEQALTAAECDGDNFLFASARQGEDLGFVRSDWNEGIEPWRFGVPTWAEHSGGLLIHTVFDRILLRPGQTVAMKHIARARGSRGMTFPDPAQLPKRLLISHDGSGAEFPLDLAWDAQGVATSQWKIPESAKRGRYALDLPGGGAFTVADFRLPAYTGRIQGAAARFVAARQIPLALGLNFLNGGAAKGAELSVSATVRPVWPQWAGYDAFGFGMNFDNAAQQSFGIDPVAENETLVLDRQTLKLDPTGAGKLAVSLPKPPGSPAELYAEMSFADPNGEIQTIRGTVPLWPAGLVLGLATPDWTTAERGKFELVALDLDGKPLAGQEIRVAGKQRITHSHLRRIVGGFYAYENRDEFVDLGELCAGKTDARGRLRCEKKVSVAGEILLLAESRDAQGHVARVGSSVWSGNGGAEDQWFAAGNQDRIDVIPEQKSYAPGETARLQVRTPFREATALIAVEADGIVETFVRPLSRHRPVVDIPVNAAWAPNVFVSVLAVRGRVTPLQWTSFFRWGWHEPLAWFKEWWRPPQPGALVDLTKPAWRMGLAEIEVGTRGMQLAVEVLPERTTYRPREAASVRLKVSAPGGKPPPAGTEIAFAAVDQALLELRENDSWNLLEAMTPRHAYEVNTATAQAQVIGKRHFGRKAVPPGGGGGRAPARELFDTLLSWQPRVKVGADGTAQVKVPLNDSLTEFRLVGIATAGSSLFGSGSARLRTRQELQLISGLPPVVREQDRYQALVTVRNGTNHAQQVRVEARAGTQTLPAQDLQLAPEGAAEVVWNAEAPRQEGPLNWEFTATEATGKLRDALRIVQRVEPAVPLTVQQSTLARLDGRLDLPVAPPLEALPGKGGVELTLAAQLAVPPPGLTRFFETYPYACLEQKVSVAVGLRDKERWREIIASLPTLLDSQGLARFFPGEGSGSVTLTAYLLAMANVSNAPLPTELRGRLEDGLQAFVEGRISPSLRAAPQSDGQLSAKLAALEALTRAGRRIPSLIRTASALEVLPQRLPTAALLDWWLTLQRLETLPERSSKLAAAAQELRNRLSYAGGRLTFAHDSDAQGWWTMTSQAANSFRLIEAVLDAPDWREELPRLLRGALDRQTRGHWSTTTANAWAVVALDAYAQRFERETVSGTTQARLDGQSVTHRWQEKDTTGRLALPWPASAGKLNLSHEGKGQPWVNLQTLAALPVVAAQSSGFAIARNVTPLQEKTPGRPSRGDLWRVRLSIDAAQEMNWVVVDDPLPAGASILGADDGRDARLATRDEDVRQRQLWPSYVERSFAAYRAYYEYVPRGRFAIEYTVRLNTAGEFTLPATRVEAMYAPEMFGVLPKGKVTVAP
jgi:uncharacterized protein YfaS (alpha-2-macroglobulin family)